MQNLRYKLLFIACALFTVVQTLLGVNASDHYTFYTREFLRNLGVRNPATVPVRRIAANDQFYHTAAGYSDGTSIHLNEDIFVNHSEGINLFTCAHESAHHALGHAYQIHRNSLAIEQEADETAGRMLCRHGYTWVLQEEVDNLRQAVRHGQGGQTDGQHPTIQQRYDYLRVILGANGNDNAARQPNNPGNGQNAGRASNGRNGRNQNAGRAGNGRNGAQAGRAGRAGNNNQGRAGQGRNGGRAGNQGPARNPGNNQNAGRAGRNNAGRDQNAGRPGNGRNGVGADRNPRPDRNQGRDQNVGQGHNNNPDRPMPENNSFGRSIGSEFRDLFNQFNDLSRAQKLVIAGILAAAFIRR